MINLLSKINISILGSKLASLSPLMLNTVQGFDATTLVNTGLLYLFNILLNFIVKVIYHICAFVLNIVDFFQFVINKIIGLGNEYIVFDTQNPLMKLLLNDTVWKVFTYVFGLAIILLIVFTIYAIIRSEYRFATGQEGDNNKARVIGRSLRSISIMAMFPIILFGSIILLNSILYGFNNVFMQASGDGTISLGGQTFTAAAYNANKYRIYAKGNQRIPVFINFDDPIQNGQADGYTSEELADIYKRFNIDEGADLHHMYAYGEFDAWKDTISYRNYKIYNTTKYANHETFIATPDQYYVMADFTDFAVKTGLTYTYKSVKDDDISWKYVDETVFNPRTLTLSITYRDANNIIEGEDSDSYVMEITPSSIDMTTPIKDAIAAISTMLAIGDYSDKTFNILNRDNDYINYVEWDTRKVCLKLSEGFELSDSSTWTVSDSIILYEWSRYDYNNTIESYLTIDELKTNGVELDAQILTKRKYETTLSKYVVTEEVDVVLINNNYYKIVEAKDKTNTSNYDKNGSLYFYLLGYDVKSDSGIDADITFDRNSLESIEKYVDDYIYKYTLEPVVGQKVHTVNYNGKDYYILEDEFHSTESGLINDYNWDAFGKNKVRRIVKIDEKYYFYETDIEVDVSETFQVETSYYYYAPDIVGKAVTEIEKGYFVTSNGKFVLSDDVVHMRGVKDSVGTVDIVEGTYYNSEESFQDVKANKENGTFEYIDPDTLEKNYTFYDDLLSNNIRTVSWPEKLISDLQVIYKDVNLELLISNGTWLTKLSELSSNYFASSLGVNAHAAFASSLIHPLGMIISELMLGMIVDGNPYYDYSDLVFSSVYDESTINGLILSLLGEEKYYQTKQELAGFVEIFNGYFAKMLDEIAYAENFDLKVGKEASVQLFTYKAYLASVLLSDDCARYFTDLALMIVAQNDFIVQIENEIGDYTEKPLENINFKVAGQKFTEILDGIMSIFTNAQDNEVFRVFATYLGAFIDAEGRVLGYDENVNMSLDDSEITIDYDNNGSVDVNEKETAKLAWETSSNADQFKYYYDRRYTILSGTNDITGLSTKVGSLAAVMESLNDYRIVHLLSQDPDTYEKLTIRQAATKYSIEWDSIENDLLLKMVKDYILFKTEGVWTKNAITGKYIFTTSDDDKQYLKDYEYIINDFTFEDLSAYMSFSRLNCKDNDYRVTNSDGDCKWCGGDGEVSFCEHSDGDIDGVCDKCQLCIGAHTDEDNASADHDGICDRCGYSVDFVMSNESTNCAACSPVEGCGHNNCYSPVCNWNVLSKKVDYINKVLSCVKDALKDNYFNGKPNEEYRVEDFGYFNDDADNNFLVDLYDKYTTGGNWLNIAYMNDFITTQTLADGLFKYYIGHAVKVYFDEYSASTEFTISVRNKQYSVGKLFTNAKLAEYVLGAKFLKLNGLDTVYVDDDYAGMIQFEECKETHTHGTCIIDHTHDGDSCKYICKGNSSVGYLLDDDGKVIIKSSWGKIKDFLVEFGQICMDIYSMTSYSALMVNSIDNVTFENNPYLADLVVKYIFDEGLLSADTAMRLGMTTGNNVGDPYWVTDRTGKLYRVENGGFNTYSALDENVSDNQKQISLNRLQNVMEYLLNTTDNVEHFDYVDYKKMSLKELRISCLNYLSNYIEPEGIDPEASQAAYLIVFYLANANWTVASDSPAVDYKNWYTLADKDPTSNNKTTYARITGISETSQSVGSVMRLAGIENRPIEDLIGLEYSININYRGIDEQFGDVFILCTYNEESRQYLPILTTNRTNLDNDIDADLARFKDSDGNLPNDDQNYLKIMKTNAVDFNFKNIQASDDIKGLESCYPIIARGPLDDNGFPTAIKIVDGNVVFYREDTYFLNTSRFKIEKYFLAIDTIDTDGNLISWAVNGITKAITGKTLAQHIVEAVPRIKIESYIDYAIGVRTQVVDTVDDATCHLDYNFYAFNVDSMPIDVLYDLNKLNVIILITAVSLLFGMLFRAFWGLISRMVNLVLYFIMGPLMISTIATKMPDKESETLTAYDTWKASLIRELLSVFSYVFSINLYFILANMVNTFEMFTTTAAFKDLLLFRNIDIDFLNELSRVVFLLGLGSIFMSLPKIFASIMEVEDIFDKGEGTYATVKNTVSTVQDFVSGQEIVDKMEKATEPLQNMERKGKVVGAFTAAVIAGVDVKRAYNAAQALNNKMKENQNRRKIERFEREMKREELADAMYETDRDVKEEKKRRAGQVKTMIGKEKARREKIEARKERRKARKERRERGKIRRVFRREVRRERRVARREARRARRVARKEARRARRVARRARR